MGSFGRLEGGEAGPGPFPRFGPSPATVDDAFNEVLALAQRRRALLADHGVESDALADPAARRDAWG